MIPYVPQTTFFSLLNCDWLRSWQFYVYACPKICCWPTKSRTSEPFQLSFVPCILWIWIDTLLLLITLWLEWHHMRIHIYIIIYILHSINEYFGEPQFDPRKKSKQLTIYLWKVFSLQVIIDPKATWSNTTRSTWPHQPTSTINQQPTRYQHLWNCAVFAQWITGNYVLLDKQNGEIWS